MPAVSGLLFRMKQNAVGLASIAILSTGVLVMISTTVSLYSGVEDTVNSNYPQHLYLSAYQEESEEIKHVPFEVLSRIVTEASQETGVEIQSIDEAHMLTVSYLFHEGKLLTKEEAGEKYDFNELASVIYITEDTYSQLQSKTLVTSNLRDLDLKEGEIAFCRIMSDAKNLKETPKTITIGGKEYKIKEELTYFPINNTGGTVASVFGIVVANEEVLNEIYLAQKESYGKMASEFASRISVTFADEDAVSLNGGALEQIILQKLRESYPGELSYSLDTKWETKHNVLDMYGTFLFLGILLGFVCLFSTILIIYYKQISEGYEDRERFQIMEKIGMDAQEVKKTIGNQLVLQFFLPLVTAAVHTAFAYPILLKLLKVLMLTNTALFIACLFITLAVFALMYTAVYLLTARTYYKIVH